MQINVSQQLKSNIGTVRNYDVDSTIDVDGYEINLRGQVHLMKTDRGIIVKGVISSQIDLQCSRCLCSFRQPLNLTIEEEYYPTMDIMTGSRLDSPEDPGLFTIDDHNIMDLSEALRQYAVLAIPIKPLCKDRCAGLCPTCGTNLNETTCDCPPAIDPRWEKLRNMVSSDNAIVSDD